MLTPFLVHCTTTGPLAVAALLVERLVDRPTWKVACEPATTEADDGCDVMETVPLGGAGVESTSEEIGCNRSAICESFGGWSCEPESIRQATCNRFCALEPAFKKAVTG